MSAILNPTINARLKGFWEEFPKPNSISPVSDDDYEAAREVFLNIGYNISERTIRDSKKEMRKFSKEEFIEEYWEQTQTNIRKFVIDHRHILFTYLDAGVPFSKIKPDLSEKLFCCTPTDGSSLLLVGALGNPSITIEDLNEILQSTNENCSAYDSLNFVNRFKMNRKVSSSYAIPFLKL